MKKLFILAVSAVACVGATYAQSDCSYLFPHDKGTTMTTQCYDAQNHLLGTTNYLVDENYQTGMGNNSDIVYSMKDASGNVINAGEIQETCNDDGSIYMKSKSKAELGDITKMLSANINLLGSYLDYPDTFDSFDPFSDGFSIDEADLTLSVKDKSVAPVRVKIYDRKFEKNEHITTPAGTFHATKISYNVDVYNSADKSTETFKNVEWYNLGKGFIRSESYNKSNQLVNYTVLTALNEK